MVEMDLPADNFSEGKIIYTDGGYQPLLNGKKITLGPEQMAVIGFNEYANEKYNLGIDETINIPTAIEKINTNFKEAGMNTIETSINGAAGKNIRIFIAAVW